MVSATAIMIVILIIGIIVHTLFGRADTFGRHSQAWSNIRDSTCILTQDPVDGIPGPPP